MVLQQLKRLQKSLIKIRAQLPTRDTRDALIRYSLQAEIDILYDIIQEQTEVLERVK